MISVLVGGLNNRFDSTTPEVPKLCSVYPLFQFFFSVLGWSSAFLILILLLIQLKCVFEADTALIGFTVEWEMLN